MYTNVCTLSSKLFIKKTRRLASPALGRRQRRSCTYTLFLKFLATSNCFQLEIYIFSKKESIDDKKAM